MTMSTRFRSFLGLAIIVSFCLAASESPIPHTVIGDDLNSFEFGFKLIDHPLPTTTPDVIITVWFDHTVYQCTVQPTLADTTYSCTASEWTILGETCPESDAQYKMMIDNNSPDSILIDYLFLFVAGNGTSGASEHRITGWCMESDSVPDGYSDFAAFEFSENHCDESYTNYDILCIDNGIDNEVSGCGPSRIVSYFDMWTPPVSFSYFVQSIENGVREDATNLDISTCAIEPDGDNLIVISTSDTTKGNDMEAASTESHGDGSTPNASDKVHSHQYRKEIAFIAVGVCIMICLCAMGIFVYRKRTKSKRSGVVSTLAAVQHQESLGVPSHVPCHSQQNTSCSVETVSSQQSDTSHTTSGNLMDKDVRIVIDHCEGEQMVRKNHINEPESCGSELYGGQDIRYISDIDDHTIGGTTGGNTCTGGSI